LAVDKRGNFISNVLCRNPVVNTGVRLQNVNFSFDLLRLGFAHVFKGGRISQSLVTDLEAKELQAKK